MNMKQMYKSLFLAVLLCLFAACGDDEKVNPSLTLGNESRPLWTTRGGLYSEMDLTMAVQLTLQNELLPYASDGDIMCAIIDGEVRAVRELQRTGGEIYFDLIIAGNSGSGRVTLKYYCDKLRRTFTLEGWMPFSPDIKPTNDGKPYVVEFISTK